MEELHQHEKALGTNKIQRRNNHRKAAQEIARYNSPVDPTRRFEQRRFNRCYSPDDPAKSNTNVGAVVQRDHKIEIQRTG